MLAPREHSTGVYRQEQQQRTISNRVQRVLQLVHTYCMFYARFAISETSRQCRIRNPSVELSAVYIFISIAKRLFMNQHSHVTHLFNIEADSTRIVVYQNPIFLRVERTACLSNIRARKCLTRDLIVPYDLDFRAQYSWLRCVDLFAYIYERINLITPIYPGL